MPPNTWSCDDRQQQREHGGASTATSRHSGVVNVLMATVGQVHQELRRHQDLVGVGTPAGGEVISATAY